VRVGFTSGGCEDDNFTLKRAIWHTAPVILPTPVHSQHVQWRKCWRMLHIGLNPARQPQIPTVAAASPSPCKAVYSLPNCQTPLRSTIPYQHCWGTSHIWALHKHGSRPTITSVKKVGQSDALHCCRLPGSLALLLLSHTECSRRSCTPPPQVLGGKDSYAASGPR
jgi:hypothetical protein